jgi:hypothetical protein
MNPPAPPSELSVAAARGWVRLWADYPEYAAYSPLPAIGDYCVAVARFAAIYDQMQAADPDDRPMLFEQCQDAVMDALVAWRAMTVTEEDDDGDDS